jgi:polyisoprenoid-binding protein YceI
MNRSVVAVLGVAAAVVVGGAVWFFTQGDAEPTTEVTAPPIADSETTQAASPETTAAEVPETTEAASDEPTIATSFELTDASSATFRIDEELRGSPVTVVGTSGIVLGRIEIDPDELSNSQIGEILINARDFETDSGLRNRAIRGPILDTDTFEFISFVPSTIEGLEGPAAIGDELTFTVSGELTIRDVTQPVTFDVSAVLTSGSTIEGTATTVVERGPFGLVIPSVPSVANVAEEVPLSLDFVAESA